MTYTPEGGGGADYGLSVGPARTLEPLRISPRFKPSTGRESR